MSSVSDHHGELDGLPVFWRTAPAPGGADDPACRCTCTACRRTPTTGLRSSSAPADWRRTSRLWALGQARQPAIHDRRVRRFRRAFLDFVGVERVSLVVHDWGAVGLAFAQRRPERVARLAYRRGAAAARFPLAPRRARLAHAPARRARDGLDRPPDPAPRLRGVQRHPRPAARGVARHRLDHFDQGTQRAILRLIAARHRTCSRRPAPSSARLAMPALVVWGAADPYIPVRFGAAYARALPDAELLELPDAGHVPWLDRPDLIDRITEFLAAT